MPPGNEKGLVFRTEKYMISDGLGIRTNVFLKGCPLKCLWCFNPEGIEGKPEILVFKRKCIQCGECIEICPRDAITMEDGHPRIDRRVCDGCGECASACPSRALEVCGRFMTVDEVMEQVRKDEIFYRRSGGGVTVTGGELCAQPGFARNLLLACREEFHTAIETSGFAPPNILREILASCDQVFFDLKHMDSRRHRELTGVPNEPILHNLEMASRVHDEITVRIPLIPGFNDEPQNIRRTAEFVRSLGNINRIEILPYVSFGRSKYEMLNLTYTLPRVKSPSSYVMGDRVTMVRKCGLECNIVD
jgi:pyruvate formate lyase activating enzyme